jgi:hypothetical protein
MQLYWSMLVGFDYVACTPHRLKIVQMVFWNIECSNVTRDHILQNVYHVLKDVC